MLPGIAALGALSAALAAHQAPSRVEDPAMAILAPIWAMQRTAPPRDVLSALDKLQPQIDGAPLTVQGRAKLLRGLVLRTIADREGAERAGQDSRALGARAGDPFIEFDALILLGNLATDRGDLDTASARLAEAVPLADRTGDDGMRFNVRLEQGRVLRQRGQGRAALAPLSEAVAIADRLGAARMQVQALTSRSSARLGLSDYDEGLADADRAYRVARATGVAPDTRGAAAFGLAQALSQIGDLERGLEYYSDALDAYTQAGFQAGISLALRQRMDVRYALGDIDEAAADGERARELFARTGSAGQQPALLSRLALIDARLGRRALAAAYARQAADGAATTQPRVRTQVESDLAQAALADNDFADATARFSRMLEQARALNDPDLEWRALSGLGRASLGAGQLVTAQARFEAAIAVVERIRRTLPEASLRADFIAERLAPYDGLIDTLLGRSRAPGDAWVARAFETSERARGRALADLLAETQARQTDPAIARVRAEEAAFGARLSELQRFVASAASDAERTRRLADLDRAERDYDAFVVRIRRETPHYAALAHPRAATAAAVAARLSPGDALVSFWLGADRGVAWVITRARVSSYPLPGRADLDRQVARLTSAVGGGQLDQVHRLSAALSAALLQKIDYARISRLIVVPDGPLWRAPLAALEIEPAHWLIERASVSVVPSASLLATLSAPPAAARPRQPGLVVGLERVPDAVRALRTLYDEQLLPDKPLAYAAAEAREVARLAQADPRTNPLLNDRADETTVKRISAAAPYSILHVASHALIDDRVPRRSALVLSSSGQDDGLLQLNEIAQLQLDVDLVVLSTCQSQIGRAVRGEGLVSLSRAFIHSGAKAVAASLWAVDDRQTSRLMPFFYTSLRDGAAPDAALRAAQLKMIAAGGAAASPASWAGFVVMGRADRAVFTRAAAAGSAPDRERRERR